MEVENRGLPLSLSDLQSPEQLNIQSSTKLLPHKLEPIQLDAIKKRKKNRTRRTKRSASQQQLGKATDDDIESYLNERMSRLDPVHQETGLDPILQGVDHKSENESKEETIAENTNLQQQQQQPQSNFSTVQYISPTPSSIIDNSHSVISNTSDQSSRIDQSEQLNDDTCIEDRRPKRRRRKKREQSLNTAEPSSNLSTRQLPNEETDSSEQQQQPLIQTTQEITDNEERTHSPSVTRRQLPELSPGTSQHLITVNEQTDHEIIQTYQLSCPTDPIYLVDEEDIREVPVTTKGPDISRVRGPDISHGKGPVTSDTGTGIGDQRIDSEQTNDDNGILYRQLPETGKFTRVHSRKGGTAIGDEEPDGITNSTSSSNTKFVMIIHNAIKRLAQGAHGILAGLSLWNSVISLTLSLHETNGHVVFLNYYNTFPLVIHSIYLLLLFLILNSILDKVDLARTNKQCIHHLLHSLSEMALLIALVLLLLAFAITVCLAFIDERIFLFEKHPNLWTDVLSPSNSTSMIPPLLTVDGYVTKGGGAISNRLNGWFSMDIVRTVCIIISWLIILYTVSIDRMEDYLCDLENQDENKLVTHL